MDAPGLLLVLQRKDLARHRAGATEGTCRFLHSLAYRDGDGADRFFTAGGKHDARTNEGKQLGEGEWCVRINTAE